FGGRCHSDSNQVKSSHTLPADSSAWPMDCLCCDTNVLKARLYTVMTFKRLTIITTIVAASALSLRGAPARHHALLSLGLLRHVERHSTARARVIVHGDGDMIDAIAARHHVQVLRRLAHSGVLAANSDELTALAADAAIDNLSGDVTVKNWMSISN